MREQDALIRIVRTGDGSLSVGRTLAGRGAWLCAGSIACFDLGVRRRAFERALRGPVSMSAVDALRKDIGAEPGAPEN